VVGATSGAEAVYYSGVHPVFSRVRVARSIVLCLCFVERCFSFCPLSFGHCVFCNKILINLLLNAQ
jgi:hypothetical protein